MFKRRDPHGFWRKLKESLWPSMGWHRTAHYYRHRVFRTGDSTYKITAGLATGVAVSFTPLLGTHFLQAAFFNWMLRGSYIASFVGTAFGNPLTFPVMIWAGYHLGAVIFSLFGVTDLASLPDHLTFRIMLEHPWGLFAPLLAGGYLLGLAAWPLAYGFLYYPVKGLQKTYQRAKLARQWKRNKGPS